MRYGSLNSNNLREVRDELYQYMSHVLHHSPYPTEEIKEEAERIAHLSKDVDSVIASIDELVEKIISSIELSSEDRLRFEVRVPCPLCGRTPYIEYVNPGFKYPEGLRRHLTGYGNVQQCTVVYTIQELGMNSSIKKFRK